MKKLVSLFLVALMATLAVFTLTACTPREEVLKIYNWGDYMDPETYKGFEDWYKEKTGKSVTVKYSEFDTNESMYVEVTQKKADYDLLCPSDYMIERMIAEDLLMKLNDETQEVVQNAVSDSLATLIKGAYDPNMEYGVPYMWGTLGIMYNRLSEGLNDEVVSNWDALWDTQFSGKIYMKDSVRDAYTIAMLRENADALISASANGYDSTEYQQLLNSIFTSTDETKIATAKTSLLEQKPLLRGYEVDSAKDDMLRDIDGKKGYLGLFWSCDAGYIMNGSEDDANMNLRYIIPEEGSNVWVDGFVISKNAVNVEAANYFIQYLCEEEVAYACMDYVGSTTGIEAGMESYKADLLAEDSDFFEGAPEGFKEMYIEMMFPTEETLKRCAIMKDFGTFNSALDTMWEEVKIS